MKYKVRFLPSFSRDVNKIADALKEYPAKAKRLLQEMDEKLLRLEDNPFMWPVYQARPKYRKLTLENHLVFYTVDEVKKVVSIYRIIYASMDVKRQLRN